MQLIYKKIVDTFNSVKGKEAFTSRGLVAPKTIDINYGQPDNPEGFEFFLPAIFVSWSINPNADQEPKTLVLDFHVLNYPDIHTESFSPQLSTDIVYLSFLNAVKFVLNNLRAANTTGLKYAGERPAITPYYRYQVLSYNCYVDVLEESLTKGTITPAELSDFEATFSLKNKEVPLPTNIDTFKK